MKPGSRQNTIGGAALQLWYAWPADLSEAGAEAACAVLLSREERERAARFRFDRHRREYLASHALARNALSHAHPLPPHAWSYSVNAYGKPTPIPECGLRFNQSNSVELAVCLVASPATPSGAGTGAEAGPEVGVDVEAFQRAEELVPLAPKVFSLAEQEQLNALPAAERPHRALSLWTLKEAYIKARGMGFALPLENISFVFERDGEIRLEANDGVDDEPGRWRFSLLDHAGHRVALMAALKEAPQLEIWEARPPLGPRTRLNGNGVRWFPG